jgi:hypothetical protein
MTSSSVLPIRINMKPRERAVIINNNWYHGVILFFLLFSAAPLGMTVVEVIVMTPRQNKLFFVSLSFECFGVGSLTIFRF